MLLPWFFLVYFPRKERIESQRLSALYGDDYDRYRAAVPALWPALRRYEGSPRERVAWSLARYDDNNELGTLLACVLGWAALAGWVAIRG